MTTSAADPDPYVDACLSRACEAIGLDEPSEVVGIPIPIEFEEVCPVTLRISRAAFVVTTPAKDHRIGFARAAVVLCAVVSLGCTAVAVAKSPLVAHARSLVHFAHGW